MHILLDHICSSAARMLLEKTPFPTYRDRLQQMLPLLLDTIKMDHRDRSDPMLRAMATQLALEIWNATPLPDHRFRPDKRPHPERNSRCPCGSGGKYKQCCGLIDAPALGINEIIMLQAVLAQFPDKALADLPLLELHPEHLAMVAENWAAQGKAKKAARLLELLFVHLDRLDARAELAADTLLNLYMDLKRPRKKQQLIAALKNAPDKALRATGWQRQSTQDCDQGRFAAAWTAFREAQRLKPNAPALAHLEILILLSENRREEAKARAQFWSARLRRDSEFDHSELIQILHQLTSGDDATLLNTLLDKDDPFRQLNNALNDWPPPACHYSLKHGTLTAKKALAELEADWHQVLFVENDPESAVLMASEEMLAGQSFLILKDLIGLLPGLMGGLPGSEDNLGGRLLERGEKLRQIVLHTLQAEQRELPWGLLANRPMQQLSAWYIAEFASTRPEETLNVLRWSVNIANPVDNLGLRAILIHQLIAQQHADEAVAVAEKYPNDFAATRYGHALALFAAGRLQDAETTLRAAYQHAPRVWKMLLAANPRPPKVKTPGYIRLGTDEEAYEYRTYHQEQWARSGALLWAAGMKLSAPRQAPAPASKVIQKALF
ncbi:MAG: SEC-C domain-containing protein [Dechloromonas sp.]|nr:SEC-C domain-containing protein [Dechloromonas sp.]